METILNLSAVALVSLVAAISPGPDFFIVLKNSLSSRKAGLFTALGVSLALIFHLTYTLIGIGVLIAENPFIYSLIKYIGVGYLFYLGFSSWKSSFKISSQLDLTAKTDSMIPSAALKQGFFTNLLNPKCALFFISLFSQFIDVNTPMLLRIEYVFINWSVSLGWFLFLAYMVSFEGFIKKLNQFRIYVDRIMGSAFMLLGMKLLFVSVLKTHGKRNRSRSRSRRKFQILSPFETETGFWYLL